MRELIEEKRHVVPYVNTTDNLADFFTKPLSANTFLTVRNAIVKTLTSLRAALLTRSRHAATNGRPLAGGGAYTLTRSRITVWGGVESRGYTAVPHTSIHRPRAWVGGGLHA